VYLEVKPVGKPDVVVPHVRFDERGWETELYATAPILDSTGMLSFNQSTKICLTPHNLMIYVIIIDLDLLLLLTDFILYLVELSLLPYRISNDFRFN
jgi:hypothetical protein